MLTCYGPGDWRLTLAYPLHDVSIVPQYEILPNQVKDPCSYPPLYWFELSPFSKASWG